MAGAAGGRREACGFALSLNIPGGRKRGLLSQVLFRRRLKSRTLPWSPGLNLSHEEAKQVAEKANCISPQGRVGR